MTETNKSLFGKDNNPSNIIPEKYTLDSKIKFRCHPGVSCFTACCGNINIILTPFDILRLRRHLNMTADEFLLRFATPMFIEQTDMPGVKIHLDEDGRCPFVTDEGCTIYSERPSACRYYPIGMANFHEGGEDGVDSEQFFFVVKEDHCKGHEEDTNWTIREWRADQGVDECDDMNKEWLELVMRRKSFGHQAALSDEAKKIFFMVSTDLDKFKKFIFNSSFLDTYIVDQKILDEIQKDDIALLKFSYKYLASSLFGTNDIKIKEEKIKESAAKVEEKRAEKEAGADETYKQLLKDREDLIESHEKAGIREKK